ncbi:winged helix-turn-helix transcriptional regulator [Flavobacterium sp. LB3P122]|uniref:winged helix-turn-helix transcriptional regulator n=1 Tax=Flavobacterium algoriphilum TaxID=3398738 RepID=UPI003A860938
MEISNGKWNISLVWCVYSGIKRPGKLQRKMHKASRRVLDTQLNQLINHGILTKITYDERLLKVEYELTLFGKTVIFVVTDCKSP